MPLYRSRRHKIIAGVCGGLAEWLGWDLTAVRVVYFLLCIASLGIGAASYIVLWAVMPKEPAL